ncbi:MAG: transcriptional regulator [Chloroflexi bacterium]|nr:MAG: transcriptional regulator [Chloroflexota bacterium]
MAIVTRERSEDQAGSLAAASLLVDSVRRRVFRFVRRARRPVTRDEAAASAGISRNLAAFHLDRLVEAGLLRAGRQTSAGPARVGRKPKVYEPGPVEVHLDVPRRQHALLAAVLVDTMAAGGGDAVAGDAVAAARRRGHQVGAAARAGAGPHPGPEAVEGVLEGLGFEPYPAGADVLRLANCPFHPHAADAPELVCGINLGLIAGLLTGLGAGAMEAVLAPRAGECCVEIRRGGPGRGGATRARH